MAHDNEALKNSQQILRTDSPEHGTRWRHTKTGHVYRVITGCVIEATLQPGVMYAAEHLVLAAVSANDVVPPWNVWVRPLAEFLDGRFVKLDAESAADST